MPATNRTRALGLALFITLALLAFGRTRGQAQTPGSGDVELGARLFAENCAVCHGAKGEGRVGATLSKDWPSIRPDLEIKNTISNGIQGSPMPAWSQANGGPLSETEIDALVAYILTWQTGGPQVIVTAPVITRPAISPVPNVQGDPNHGAALYDQNCAVCHGANLEGRVGATLAKSWPSIRPDLQVKNTISNGIQGSPMPAWSQANGGPLSEAEINDLTAFVLSNQTTGPTTPETAASAASATPSPFAGWGGILLASIAFILIVGIAIIVQTRR